MSAKADRTTFFKLVQALEDGGVKQPHKVAQAISKLINGKVSTSEGRHYAKCHKVRPLLNDDSLPSVFERS